MLKKGKKSYTKILTAVLLTVSAIYLFCPTEKVYSVELNSEVNAKSVKPIIEALNKADSSDIVVINIMSPGGEIMSGYQLINAIERTKAKKVVMNVSSYAASMSAMLLCFADEVNISDRAIIFYHDMQVNGAQLVVIDNETKALRQSFFNTLDHCNFLNEYDVKTLIEGKEIWFVGGLERANRI